MSIRSIRGNTVGTNINLEKVKEKLAPKISITDIDGGHRITITDADGTKSFDILNKVDLPIVKGTSNGATIIGDIANNIASGEFSSAYGHETKATGKDSTARGHKTLASGENSYAEGYNSEATNGNAHAEGGTTKAKGNNSHSQNYYTHALSDFTHSEGHRTTSAGIATHAEGISNDNVTNIIQDFKPVTSNPQSNGTPNDTIKNAWKNIKKFLLAKGRASHAGGENCLALGNRTFAHGYQCIAEHDESSAWGLMTRTSAKNQSVRGKYNADESTALDIVGCGTSDLNRKNCYSSGVDNNGEAYLKIGTAKITENQLIYLLGLSTKEFISFTIDGAKYTAPEGWTWGQWITSGFNTRPFGTSGSMGNRYLHDESTYEAGYIFNTSTGYYEQTDGYIESEATYEIRS